ncbi:MAG: hypothetical protein JW874_06650 [Spirochaetales bacterium]|nr:hypothetical protein [Spirochaetales bacterium]
MSGKKIRFLIIFIAVLAAFFSCTRSSGFGDDGDLVRSGDITEPTGTIAPLPGDPDGFNLNEADFFDDPNDIKTVDPNAPLRTDSDVSGITVNYFNPDDFDMSGFIAEEDGTPLEIVDYGPEGQLPNEMTRRPTIYCVFSKPIVPLSKLGDPLTESPYMSIEPKIAGVYRWYGSKMLSFEPADKVMPQREYTMTVSGVKSLGGSRLEKDLTFSFYTEYIEFETVFPHVPNSEVYINRNDIPPEYVRKMTAQLTYPFDIDLMKSYIEVEANGRKYPFRLSRFEDFKMNPNLYERTCILEFDKEFPQNTEISVTLRKGARSYKDSLGRPDAQTMSMHTLQPFTYYHYDTYSYSYRRSSEPDSNPLYLYFSHPLVDDPDRIAAYIRTSFDIPDLTEYIEIYGTMIRINNLPVEYESTYHVTLLPGLPDVYGRTLSGQTDIDVYVGRATSYANYRDYGFKVLEAQYEPKILIEYQNVEHAFKTIEPVSDPLAHTFSQPTDFELLAGMDNRKHFQLFNLKEHLNSSGYGTVGIYFDLYNIMKNDDGSTWWNEWENMMVLQVTDLGATVRFAYNKAIVVVRSLTTGKPVEGARVELFNSSSSTGYKAVTDKNGFVSIPIREFNFAVDDWRFNYWNSRKSSSSMYHYIHGFIVKISKDDDRLYYQPGADHNRWDGTIYGTSSPWDVENPRYSVMLFTDRGLYKPGEEIVIRGISQYRSVGDYEPSSGDYKLVVDSKYYYSTKSGGDTMFETEGTLSGNGGFFHKFTIPKTAAPDSYTVHFYKSNIEYANETFRIAEFKRAEFQVNIPPADSLFYAGDKIALTGKGEYLSGGAMAGADARYVWNYTSTGFMPDKPEYSGYVYSKSVYAGRQTLGSEEGNLDGSGSISMEQQTGANQAPGVPYEYQVELYVQDISRQELMGLQSTVVHPADHYIGAKIASNEVRGWWNRYVKKGDKMDIEMVKVTPDQQKYEKKTKVRAEVIRKEWKSSSQSGVYGRMNYRWEMVEITEQNFDLEFGYSGKFSFTPENAGSYLLRLSSEDSDGRQIVSELDFYVTGSSWINWRLSAPDKIDLVPDRLKYSPGDTARIFVKSPLPAGEYMLSIEREGILEEKIIRIEGSSEIIEIPVKEEYVPVMYVALCSSSERKEAPESMYGEDLGKPRGYFGMASFLVSTEPKELKVEILPDKSTYLPGTEAEVEIRVSYRGKPVQDAEVTFLAVDRGVLDLINYHVPDPVSFFYSPYRFPHAVYGGDSRSILIDPVTYEVKDLAGGDGDKDKMKRREDFRPLAVFEPYLKTDKKGIARVRFKLPDTLTTYRSTAFVVHRDRFGFNEEEIFVRNPITVRTAMPQAMRLRDTAEIGCILTNLSDDKHRVKVHVKSDTLKLDDKDSRIVTIKPNETLEVPFKFIAVKEGEATLEFTIRSKVLNEILVQKMEVEYTVIREAFTVIGHTDKVGGTGSGNAADKAVEAFVLPRAIDGGYGGISLTLTSNPLPSATSAIEYFDSYYHKWYQTGILSLLYGAMPHMLFGQTISEIAPRIPYSASRQLEYGMRIQQHKFRDGGYLLDLTYKDRREESDLWFTVLVAQYEALARLRDRGVLNNDAVDSMLACMQRRYNKVSSPLFKARMLYILALFDRDITGKLDELMKEVDSLGMTGYLYCGLAYDLLGQDTRAQEILKYVRKFIKVGTRTVDFIQTYEMRDYWDSQTHRLALLDLLYYQQKGIDDMMITYSNTINKSMHYGYWGTPADTLWVMIAAAEIERQESTTDTNIDVDVSLSDIELWKTRFTGASSRNQTANYKIFEDPIAQLKRDTPYPLSFNASGTGQLFYAATFIYALPAEIITARDEGLGIFRQILDLDGNKVKDNELKLGETYRMKVVVSSSKTRYNMGLRVPVPSGCDVLDSSFVTTGSYADQGGTDNREWDREMFYGDEETFSDEGYADYDGGWWSYSMRPQKRIYKNQVTYRFGMFYRGQQTIDFLFRATTPGIYPTPPALAEVLDEPEVFGRSEGILVRVK